MPKMKTNKTAAKRFRKTGTGKLRRLPVHAPAPVREEALHAHAAPRRHASPSHPGDEKRVKRLLGER